MRAAALLIAAAVALSVGGCGGSTKRERPRVDDPRAATAERVIRRLWRAQHLQDAALPAYYDDRLLEILSPRELAYGLGTANADQASEPEVLHIDSTRQGWLVSISATPEGGTPVRSAYVIRRVGVDWKVVYDSHLAEKVDALSELRATIGQRGRRAPRVRAPVAARLIPIFARGRNGPQARGTRE